MSLNLRELHGLAIRGGGLITAATLASAVGGMPPMAQATGGGVHSMQMGHAPPGSSKTIVLKHRHVVHVNIQNLAFRPSHLVVSPGTKIIWTNMDGFDHTTTSDTGVWDSGPIGSANHFAYTFKRTGTFTYHCTIHPFMHGTITVQK
jgi:plastocyanin